MSKEILHIWGPFSIQSYGLCMAIGILVASWLFLRDKRRESIISYDQFNKVITFAIIIAIVGGRSLFLAEESESITDFLGIFKIWEGGLSSLGAILSVLIFVPIYLNSLGVNFIRFFDLAALYAPIIECIARIGCFTAGCCFGMETSLPWAVLHKEYTSLGQTVYKYVHPTQIYSSIVALFIFILMQIVVQKRLKKQGQLIAAYLMLTSLARFSIDFLRGDRTYFDNTASFSSLSSSQLISILICLLSFISIILIQIYSKKTKNK
ncbi:MAG: Lgt: prolipoprotein diacylglycyeryl transferase [candidate division TM6 bacterium GW2011_GWF2_30_66]|jgi:phosphatidylglycerol:prolipoprotein diacylglycerol transferase|nr:MAG: Lgt: prolipoprotein diacylglycyeryl transferase [candidate division TM6 bacterium GW2011_GWF2_30_66]